MNNWEMSLNQWPKQKLSWYPTAIIWQQCKSVTSLPQNGWFIRENPIRIDDLGGIPYFWKHPHVVAKIKFKLLFHGSRKQLDLSQHPARPKGLQLPTSLPRERLIEVLPVFQWSKIGVKRVQSFCSHHQGTSKMYSGYLSNCLFWFFIPTPNWSFC